MTDEMIQQVPQQRGSYAVPGLIGGAIAGGAAGVAGAHYKNWGITTKPDLDKVFAQKPDEFTSMAERAGENKSKVEQAKDIVKGVQDLESEYDKKIEELKKTGGITDSDLPKEMVDRRNNAQTALDRIIEQETAKYSNSGSVMDSKKFPEFKDINTADLPTTNAKNGKPFKPNQIEAVYKNLTNEVINAENALETNLNTTLRADKNLYIRLIEDANSQASSDLVGKSDAEIAQYFAEKEEGSFWTGKKKPTKQYQRALDIAELKYEMPTTLSDEEFLQIGKDIKPGEKVPSGCSTKTVKYKAENGRELYKTIYFEDKVAQEMLETNKAQVKQLQAVAADEIFAETQKSIAIARDINGLKDSVQKSIPVEKAKATGLYIPATGGAPDRVNITQIIAEGDRTTYGFTRSKKPGAKMVYGYGADIQRLEDIIAAAKKAGTTPVLPATGLNSTFASGTSVEDALKQLRERNAIYKDYKAQLKGLNAQLEESVSNNPILRELNEKIAAEYAGNERLVRAKEALAKQFPSLFAETEQTLTPEEIKAKVNESKVVKDAETKLNGIKDEIAKHIEEKGLKAEITEEEAIKKFGKTKQEFVKAAKDEAKTKVEELFKDVKFANKTWTGLAAAATIGILGALAGSAMKKDA